MKKLLGIGLVAVLGSGAVSAACVTQKYINDAGQVFAGKVCSVDEFDLREAGYLLKETLVEIGGEQDGGDLGVMENKKPSPNKPVRGGNSTGGGTTTPTLPTVEPGGGTIPVSFPPKTNPNDPNSGGSGGF